MDPRFQPASYVFKYADDGDGWTRPGPPLPGDSCQDDPQRRGADRSGSRRGLGQRQPRPTQRGPGGPVRRVPTPRRRSTADPVPGHPNQKTLICGGTLGTIYSIRRGGEFRGHLRIEYGVPRFPIHHDGHNHATSVIIHRFYQRTRTQGVAKETINSQSSIINPGTCFLSSRVAPAIILPGSTPRINL